MNVRIENLYLQIQNIVDINKIEERKLTIGKGSRKTFEQLNQESLNLAKQTEMCKKAFEQTSKKDIDTREGIFREYLHSFINENLAKIDILYRLSPKTAKNLRNNLVNWEKITLEDLTKDRSHNETVNSIPENQRQTLVLNMRNNDIDVIIDFGMSPRRFVVDTCLSATVEAMKKSGNKPPLQMDEYVSNLLLKHFPKYLKCYEGAWQAFESGNPDKFRHISASLRELIKNILGDDKEKRRDTIKQLSDSETENDFIESLVETIYANDRLLNKGVHSDLEESVATLSMRTCEIILQYVLERQKSKET